MARAPARTEIGFSLLTRFMTYRPPAKKTTATQTPSSAASPPRAWRVIQNTSTITGAVQIVGITAPRSIAANGGPWADSGAGGCGCVMVVRLIVSRHRPLCWRLEGASHALDG